MLNSAACLMLKPEQIAQINIVAWFKHNYPEYAEDISHTANERKCSLVEGKILKRMGVTAGHADLFLAVPANGKCGLYIELKVGDGKLSKEQKAFLARKIMRGYEAVAVWGADAAKEVIKTYLGKSCS